MCVGSQEILAKRPPGVREGRWKAIKKEANARLAKNPNGAVVPRPVFGYSGLHDSSSNWKGEAELQELYLKDLQKKVAECEITQAQINEKLKTRTQEHARLVKQVMRAIKGVQWKPSQNRAEEDHLEKRLKAVKSVYELFQKDLTEIEARFDMQDSPPICDPTGTEQDQPDAHRLNDLLSLSKVCPHV